MAVTYEPITTIKLGGGYSSFTFSSIPNTYTDLKLVIAFNAASSAVAPKIRFNGDSGNNYSNIALRGDGTSILSIRNSSVDYIGNVNLYSGLSTAMASLNIFSYAGSTYKSVLLEGSADQNGSGYVFRSVGVWVSTAAITSITVAEWNGYTFSSSTYATLYGIKKA